MAQTHETRSESGSESGSEFGDCTDPYFTTYGGLDKTSQVRAIKAEMKAQGAELKNLKSRMVEAKAQLLSEGANASAELSADFYAMSDKAWELSELQHELSLKLESARRAAFYKSLSHSETIPHPKRPSPPPSPSTNERPQISARERQTLAKPTFYKSGDDISLFLERFQEYVSLHNIQDKNLNLYLLSLIKDDKMYRKLKSVKLSPAQQSNAPLLVAAYIEHIFPASETRLLRSSMSTLRQKRHETIPDFISRIEDVGSKAYSDEKLKEEALISSLMSGVHDLKIRAKLLECETESFEEISKLATKLERISSTLSESFPTPETDFDVLQVNETNPNPIPPQHNPRPSLPTQSHANTSPSPQVTCYGCHQLGHKRNRCPYRNNSPNYPRNQRSGRNAPNIANVQCYFCQGYGHYASNCAARQNQNPRNPHPTPTGTSFHRAANSSSHTQPRNPPNIGNRNNFTFANAVPQNGNNNIPSNNGVPQNTQNIPSNNSIPQNSNSNIPQNPNPNAPNLNSQTAGYPVHFSRQTVQTGIGSAN